MEVKKKSWQTRVRNTAMQNEKTVQTSKILTMFGKNVQSETNIASSVTQTRDNTSP